MENASKALMMAGGVLIGVLIISLAVYLFADFGSRSASINAQNTEKQLAAFNSKFTSYQDFKDKDGNWQITIYNIITLKGYATENNNNYEDTEEKIDVKIGNSSTLGVEDITLIQKYVGNNGELQKFECTDVKYNNRGKIKSISFKAI